MARERGRPRNEEREIGGRELLSGSTFTLTAGSAEDGFGTFWGRGAVSSFEGEDSGVTMQGEVGSVLLGAEFDREDATLGVMLGHSVGDGTYHGDSGGGEVASSLTGLYPWGRLALGRQLTLWGVAGYGAGTLTLTPEGSTPVDTGMNLAMAATGVRGEMTPRSHWAPMLAFTADAMAVRTTSDAANTPSGGRLAAGDAAVTRLRLGVEGSKTLGLGERWGSLTPLAELGLRHDAGDAERGFGVEVGAGAAWSNPGLGIEAELRARTLLSHEAEGFADRGVSATLTLDPTPDTERGFSLSVVQSAGAADTGGTQALLERETMSGLGTETAGVQGQRLETTVGYGFGVLGGRFIGTPQAGFVRSSTQWEKRLEGRLGEVGQTGFVFGLDVESAWSAKREGGEGEHRLGLGFGGRLEEEDTPGRNIELRFEAARTQGSGAGAETDHTIGVRLTAQW